MLSKLETVFDSLIFKITAVMVAVLLLAVVSINYFPAAVTRQLMTAANETRLETTAGSLSALLESAAQLDTAGIVSTVMDEIDAAKSTFEQTAKEIILRVEEEIMEGIGYQVQIVSSHGNIFKNGGKKNVK